MRAPLLVPLVLAGALLLGGCGPVHYLVQVTARAQRALAEAKTAGAERLAPYHYWSAVTYLEMAREKAGYADYQLAIRYGEISEEMSDQGRRLAVDRAQSRTAPGKARPAGHGTER
ncbi:MAG: DUF4398 domain-containing protein [Deltaproteobacteria bacterium]|nr:DUF4398 domain-containing protein [Deltaproteobacteria bacterium]